MQHTRRASTVRFGTYEVDFDSGELRKAGLKIRVQRQPFKVLEALLERPGEVVTREELRSRIWPDESFGDFDQAVNVAVAKLRVALGDSADNPRFIETLSKRGYRFVAPVQRDPAQRELASSQAVSHNDTSSSAITGFPHPQPSIVQRHGIKLTIATGLVVVVVVALILVLRPTTAIPEFLRISYGRGSIRSARFGPDGLSIVYGAAWNGKPRQIFWTQPENPESRPYALPNADILAISSSGQMAVLLDRKGRMGWSGEGTLALMSIAGAAPREILDHVQDADWDGDGGKLAIIHWVWH